LTKYDREITLPNNLKLNINIERIQVSEPLFDPKIIHVDYMSLAEAVSKVIKAWDRENWEELISNIIFAGGGSLIPGLAERLKNELKNFFSEKLKDKINVIAPSGRENMGWIGASILYSKEQLNKGWIENPKHGRDASIEEKEE
jgi:centractin